ncbi:NCOA3-like protein, partial [Mya arenaria]
MVRCEETGNKCLNERRRRDQENQYFEELADIISASVSDMSGSFALKPEKCAILQETVKQIKQIKQGGEGDSAVQQSHVSSSKPGLITDDILGTLLLERLALGSSLRSNTRTSMSGVMKGESVDESTLVSASEGESVGENKVEGAGEIEVGSVGESEVESVCEVDVQNKGESAGESEVESDVEGVGEIEFERAGEIDVENKGEGVGESEVESDVEGVGENKTERKVESDVKRMGGSEIESEGENKGESEVEIVIGNEYKTGIGRKEDLVGKSVYNIIHVGDHAQFSNSLLQSHSNDNEDLEAKQTYVHQYENMQISTVLHPPNEIKAENTDNSAHRFSCPDFVGQSIQEFCHPNDLQQISRHLQEVIQNGQNTSAVYRFKMQENRFVFVQTKSKLFQNPNNVSSDFIMSTHSIIRECDSDSEKGSASTSLMKSIIGPSLQLKNQLRATHTATSGINTSSSMSNMAISASMNSSASNMNSFNSGNILSALSNSDILNLGDTDFLNDMWDSPDISDSNVSSTGNLSASFHGTATTTTASSWMTQLRLSQVKDLQRSSQPGGWGHQPLPSPGPYPPHGPPSSHQGLTGMSHYPSTPDDRLLQQLTSSHDPKIVEKKTKKPGQLCRLLAQTSPPPTPITKSEPTTPKVSNQLLKSLLSQDDDVDEDFGKMGKSVADKVMEQAREAQSTNKPSTVEMEKNEAEAKKQSNKLLKESTSIDSELTRQRHQSGPQEPQSTTSLPLPVTPLSNSLTAGLGGSTINTSMLQDFLSLGGNMSQPLNSNIMGLGLESTPHNMGPLTNPTTASMTNPASANVTLNDGKKVFSMSDLSTNIKKNKSLDDLFNMLWEDQTDHERRIMREKLKNFNIQRRISSESGMEGSPAEQSRSGRSTPVGQSSSSKLSNNNMLLTELLSKRVNNEIVVNTLSTIQPSQVPQVPRIPQNLANKLLKVNPSNFVTSSSAPEAKRPRLDIPSSGLTTLEKVLRRDSSSNVSSSTTSMEGVADTSNNSNSALSTISDNSITSQLGELQNLFQQSTGSRSNLMEVNLDENTDHVLAQILQQAQDLQQEISTAGGYQPNPLALSGISSAQSALTQDTTNHSVNTSIRHSVNAGNTTNSVTSSNNYHTSVNNNSVMNTNIDSSQTNSNAGNELLQQLEQALSESSFNLNDLDLLLSNQGNTSADEQSAIEAIQQQLMSDIPMQGLSGTSQALTGTQIPQVPIDRNHLQNRFQQQSLPELSGHSSQLGGLLSSLSQGQHSPRSILNQIGLGQGQGQGQFPQGLLRTDPAQGLQRGPQGPGFGPQGAAAQSFPSQGPRLPHPPGSGQRQFSNPNPQSTAMQVRQSLLHQQKLKMQREREKEREREKLRVQQQSDRQKLVLQQQQQQHQQQQQQQRFQGPQFPSQQRFSNLPTFPENLADMMNSGNVPNVTLQRNNGLPGPMSPRYQGGSQYSNRHRSMSGGTPMQTSPTQRFSFADGQYGGSAPVGGRGSPRSSQGGFGASNDPLLMSPHNVSPNSMRVPQQQVSPPYSAGSMTNTTYGPPSVTMATAASALPSPQYAPGGQGHMGVGADHDLALFDSSKKGLDGSVPGTNPGLVGNNQGSSQFIKQELRNICKIRSQSGSQMISQPSPQYMAQQQQQQQQQQHSALQQQQQQQHQQQQQQLQLQQQSSADDGMSELPLDILEQINEMTEEHGIEDFKEEVIVPKKHFVLYTVIHIYVH